MPNVADYSNENDWMGACVPKMVNEGKDQDQAVAACMSMWKEKKSFYGLSLEDAIKRFLTLGKLGDKKSIIACIDLCRWCAQTCVDCMKACQSSNCTDMEVMKACMEACHHCIAACTFCASVCETENVDAISQACLDCVAACQSCADACEACAAACPDVAETCSACSDICERCAEVCQSVAGNKAPMADMETMSMKRGARNNAKDQQRIQNIHDYAVENGAMCKKSNGKSEPVDELTVIGNTIKAVKLDDGSVKLGGYLLGFSDETNPDLTGDFFTKNTDFGDATESDVYLNHRLPIEADGVAVDYKAKLGKAKLVKDDVGIFAETIIKARNAYEKVIAEMGLAGRLSWSSGTAGHLVDREPTGKAWQIKSWVLGLDASLTPTPAEPRNQVIPLKSINKVITSASGMTDTGDQTKQAQITKENDMNESELKAMLESNNKTLVDTMKAEAKSAAKEAFTEMLDGLPEVKAKLNGRVEVTQDPADVPFKNMGENLSAIAKRVKTQTIHPRLKGLAAWEIATAEANGDKDAAARAYKAALGSNEGVPSKGEFLLEPTITRTLLQNIHEQGVFSKDAQNLPVGPNSNSGWIPGIDETSRATGSRWGGVRGYHASEAATLTASQPKFRKINWELHKIYVLQYATDEMLNDVGLLNAVIEKSSMEELDWTFNNDLVNGIGGDRPVGVLQSNALISIARAAISAIGHADIVSMWARMLPRSKASAKWYVSSDVHSQLDQLTFTSGTTGILSPYISYGADGVMRIYGKEVVETEFNPALGTLGDILLGDMSQYLTWEKNAVEAASSIHVQFLTDQTAFRYIYRADGQTALNSAITPANGGNTQSNFVALLATT